MDSAFANYPFIWLYGEREKGISDEVGYYDEDLCVNVNNSENKIPLVLMDCLTIDTRTITDNMKERTDSDE
jgi:hypothetical protein